jgi:hypothetical protein
MNYMQAAPLGYDHSHCLAPKQGADRQSTATHSGCGGAPSLLQINWVRRSPMSG